MPVNECVRTRMRVRVCVYMCVYMCVYVCVCVCARDDLYTCVHTCMMSLITHTHTHTPAGSPCCCCCCCCWGCDGGGVPPPWAPAAGAAACCCCWYPDCCLPAVPCCWKGGTGPAVVMGARLMPAFGGGPCAPLGGATERKHTHRCVDKGNIEGLCLRGAGGLVAYGKHCIAYGGSAGTFKNARTKKIYVREGWRLKRAGKLVIFKEALHSYGGRKRHIKMR